jgi:hypothetical protein
MRLQRHRGHKRSLVAAARKLALILHAMWRDGSEFRFGQAPERRPEGRSSAYAASRQEEQQFCSRRTSLQACNKWTLTSSVPRRLENGRAMTAWGQKNRWGIRGGDAWTWRVWRRRRAQYRAYCRAAERPSERV